jgi:hypothetical protein
VSVRVYTLEVFDNATGVLRAIGLQALRSIAGTDFTIARGINARLADSLCIRKELDNLR